MHAVVSSRRFPHAVTVQAAIDVAPRAQLVVGADVMSSIIDYTDRTTCVLFGDGAGAVVLEASEEPEIGIIDSENYVDGSGGPALCMPAGGSRMPPSVETVEKRLHYVKQDGQSVFKFAVRNFEEVCRRILERNRLEGRDIDLFVPPSHDASTRPVIPEPSAALVFGAGLFATGWATRRRAA